jgi:hypothetical protein
VGYPTLLAVSTLNYADSGNDVVDSDIFISLDHASMNVNEGRVIVSWGSTSLPNQSEWIALGKDTLFLKMEGPSLWLDAEQVHSNPSMPDWRRT